ncbi:MAG: hypothetical protein ABFD50_17215 [Smithella sp.]
MTVFIFFLTVLICFFVLKTNNLSIIIAFILSGLAFKLIKENYLINTYLYIDLEYKTFQIIDKGFFKFQCREEKFNYVKKISFNVLSDPDYFRVFLISIETDNKTYFLGKYFIKRKADEISQKISNYYNVPIDYITDETGGIFGKSRKLTIDPAYNYSYTPGSYLFGGLFFSLMAIAILIQQKYFICLFTIPITLYYFYLYYKAYKNKKYLPELQQNIDKIKPNF